MDIGKRIAVLLLWSISSSAFSASQPTLKNTEINSASLPGVQIFKPQIKTGHYWVQVGATKSTPATEHYAQLFSVNSIIIHQDINDINRVMVGPFETFSDAVMAQQKARKHGIRDAFFRFSERTADKTSSRYWVQLSASKEPLNFSSIVKLRPLSQIKILRSDNGLNRILVGPFTSHKEAESIRLASKASGMNEAFILPPSEQPLAAPVQ